MPGKQFDLDLKSPIQKGLGLTAHRRRKRKGIGINLPKDLITPTRGLAEREALDGLAYL